MASGDSHVALLDVRSAPEFNEVHIERSINIPIDMLGSKTEELGRAGQTYVVLCHSGTRSAMAADILLQAGIHRVKTMDGGIARWQKEKLPVIKGKSSVSLERQVRIIAGSLIALGIVLARFMDGAFIWISILISCGLIFAGITETCLMGMLLMRLPYNRKAYTAKTGGGTCSISQ
jgi:rhodanese-related sulfurtransferase